MPCVATEAALLWVGRRSGSRDETSSHVLRNLRFSAYHTCFKILQHTGEKPFKCSHCDYTAARKGQVTVHERTHTGERPYACKFCPLRFAVSGALLVHSRRHTGERPYQYV